MSIRYRYRIRCLTDSKYEYEWTTAGDTIPSACPVNGTHSIEVSHTVVVETDRNAALPSDPTVNDDENLGYIVGDRWINSSTQTEFLLIDNTNGAAVWARTPSGSHSGNIETLPEKSTTATVYREELSYSTGSVPTGYYRIGWAFEWNLTSTSRKFIARIQVDNTTDIFNISREPKDKADWHSEASFAYVNLTAGVHTFDLDYKTNDKGATAKVRNARFEFWRA